jgi:hypothetical protein
MEKINIKIVECSFCKKGVYVSVDEQEDKVWCGPTCKFHGTKKEVEFRVREAKKKLLEDEDEELHLVYMLNETNGHWW